MTVERDNQHQQQDSSDLGDTLTGHYKGGIDQHRMEADWRLQRRSSLRNGTIDDYGGSRQKASTISLYDRLSMERGREEVVKEEIMGKRIGFYRIRSDLGNGNFSQVKLAVHGLTRENVAIKILDKTKLDAKTQRLLSQEVSCMERLHHPNIIRLYEVLESMSRLFLIMEYAAGGELYTKITTEGRLSERVAKSLLAQVVAAVKHMHDRKIVHRDLKSENVFFTGPSTVKLGDFGFSTRAAADQSLTTFCGSPPCAAPELFRDDHYHGPPVDVWALGVMLYFMVVGLMPFRSDTVGKLKRLIQAGDYILPGFVTDSCKQLLSKILCQSPSERPTIEEIIRHSWLEGEEFPRPYRVFQMTPRTTEGTGKAPRQDEEVREAQRIMAEMGIPQEHIQSAASLGSKSPVTGTYRIILHQIYRRDQGEEVMEKDIRLSARTTRSGSAEIVRSASPSNQRQRRQAPMRASSVTNTKKPSKLCIIL